LIKFFYSVLFNFKNVLEQNLETSTLFISLL